MKLPNKVKIRERRRRGRKECLMLVLICLCGLLSIRQERLMLMTKGAHSIFISIDLYGYDPTFNSVGLYEDDSASNSVVRLYENDSASKHIMENFEESNSLLITERNLLDADAECAEGIYREVFPEVNEFIQNGTFKSGKEHYWNIGHLNSAMYYYCPRVCNRDPKCTTVSECADDECGEINERFKCNKEERYINANPQVKRAIENGEFESGYEHYKKFGRNENKVYECPIYDLYQKEATGTKHGCYDTFNEFIETTTPLVKKWPVIGDNSIKLKNETCKAVLYIDGRDQEWMDYVLRTHRRYTGPEWMFYLLGPNKVTKKWRDRYDGPMVKIIDIPSRFGDLSDYPNQINDLYRSSFLWEEVIECEHVLVTQSDALLLRDGIEDFFKYSYVGSPVYPESHPTLDWRLIFSRGQNRIGGNGGLSLRRKSLMLKSLEECSIPKQGSVYVSEDGWYSACLLELGASLPTPTMANRFSTGSTCDVDFPVGVHKLWQNCQKSTCAQAIMTSSLYRDLYGSNEEVPEESEYCEEGDMVYLDNYPGVKPHIKSGRFKSGYEHWRKFGRHERKVYRCMYPKYCREGDMMYLDNYPGVKPHVESGRFKTGYDHWRKFGKAEGKVYRCIYSESAKSRKDSFDVDKKLLTNRTF